MNICLLNDSFPPLIDGVVNVVVNYATQIEEKYGHAIVVTPDHPEKHDEVYPFEVLRYPSIDMRKMTGYMAGVPFSAGVEGKLKKDQVDILHTHCPIASCFLARALRETVDAPIILTYHTKFNIDIEKVIKSKVLQEASIHALVKNISACDDVWVVSRGAGENLRSLGYKGDYVVMPNGVDLPKGKMPETAVQEVCGGYDLPEDLPVFLFVGRMMWYKGVRISLDALSMLDKEGKDFRMVLVGSGADEKEIRAYVKELGLEKKVIFTGSVSDRNQIRCWYTRARLFLFPSTFDTNGLVVREASACGLPSVLIAGSCAAEDVTDNQNAFLIEENAASMAQKLREIGWDFSRMEQVGENASNQIYISWEDAVAHAQERYAYVLQKYRAGEYPVHENPVDEFLLAQGDIMDGLAFARMQRDELEEDIIAKHIMHKESLQRKKKEIVEEFKGGLKEGLKEGLTDNLKESLLDGIKDALQEMDAQMKELNGEEH